MKKDIHPPYRPVVFRDIGADFAILTRSTRTSERTLEWTDGQTYPVIDVDVSSASHPFYTGRSRVLDTAGGSSGSTSATALAIPERAPCA